MLSLLDRLNAAARLLALASNLVPKLGSKDSVTTISSQIERLQSEIQKQIDATERSMQGFEDRLETIAQFLLLHRSAISSEEVAEVQRLDALDRG
jgi:hypothetical protein